MFLILMIFSVAWLRIPFSCLFDQMNCKFKETDKPQYYYLERRNHRKGRIHE